MTPSFDQQFDQHGAWRRGFAHRLKWLANWLRDNDLMNAAVSERMSELDAQMRASQVSVAFVAEFSRGKSELINAIFFAGYGRRIMPASAGRTTMCPTELRYDADQPTGLRLLPIETRLESNSLAHWRNRPERWAELRVNVDDAEALSATMAKVAEVDRVSIEQARALGFWNDESPDDNPRADAQGQVEVPRWRHAVLNMPHPLLAQGLVILDTPGLNAIGAEPELTVNLIPQAHAVVFILGADTGVTRSDLAIWREHLVPAEGADTTRLVVLNKIDTLWDKLSAPGQIDAQLERQCANSAETLGVPRERVIPVSAQKALQAKVDKDDSLLRSSRLPALEAMLGQGLLGRRETMLRLAVDSALGALRTEAHRLLTVRRRDLSEQTLELQGLRGKNANVVRHMRARIEQEQTEFESSAQRILALRTVQGRQLRDIYASLGRAALQLELNQLSEALQGSRLKLNARAAYGNTFEALRRKLQEVQQATGELHSMLNAGFRRLNAEHGFTLQVPPEPNLREFMLDLDGIEQSHLRYLGLSNLIRLAQTDFCERLMHALGSRVRALNDTVAGEIERWSKAAHAQLDTQLKERRRSFMRRIESLERIQQAADGLGGRLDEIHAQEQALDALGTRLDELVAHFASPEIPIAAAPARGSAGALRVA